MVYRLRKDHRCDHLQGILQAQKKGGEVQAGKDHNLQKGYHQETEVQENLLRKGSRLQEHQRHKRLHKVQQNRKSSGKIRFFHHGFPIIRRRGVTAAPLLVYNHSFP